MGGQTIAAAEPAASSKPTAQCTVALTFNCYEKGKRSVLYCSSVPNALGFCALHLFRSGKMRAVPHCTSYKRLPRTERKLACVYHFPSRIGRWLSSQALRKWRKAAVVSSNIYSHVLHYRPNEHHRLMHHARAKHNFPTHAKANTCEMIEFRSAPYSWDTSDGHRQHLHWRHVKCKSRIYPKPRQC